MRIARPFGSVNPGLAGQQTPVAQAEPRLGSCLATTSDPSSRHGPSIPRALDRLLDPVDRAADGIASMAMRSAVDLPLEPRPVSDVRAEARGRRASAASRQR